MEMELKNRKNNRLPGYDYGQVGSYFITLCTYKRAKIFRVQKTWHFASDDTVLGNNIPSSNDIVCRCLKELEIKFSNIRIDKFVIMPDHIHVIITLRHLDVNVNIPKILQHFKTRTTNDYISAVKNGYLPAFYGKVWQKSYYDHVIRNQQDFNEVWEYIENNPLKLELLKSGDL